MNAIKATWQNGQIVPDEQAEWPEGCRLLVEPIAPEQSFGIRDEDWPDTPEAVADWLKWYDSLEPLEFTPAEEADLATVNRDSSPGIRRIPHCDCRQ